MTSWTLTMMVKAYIDSEKKEGPDHEIIQYMKKLPKDTREKDDTVQEYVKNLKFRWERGTKIEKMATLGWNQSEAVKLLCNILENGQKILSEYTEMEGMYGTPREFQDQDLEQFEEAMKIFRTKK